MNLTVTATFSNGVFTPAEPIEIEDGSEVLLSIGDVPRVAGGLAAMADRIVALHESMPEGAHDDGLPPDFAMNKKHYLCGHPKEDGE